MNRKQKRMRFGIPFRAAAWAVAAAFALCHAPAGLAAAFQAKRQLRQDMPAFLFTLEYGQRQYGAAETRQRDYTQEGSVFEITAIRVSTENGGEIQRVTIDPPAETADEETFGFVIEDMNFDGFADMRVQQFVSAGVSSPYHCWLWDPAAGGFAYSAALSAIPSPLFDADSQRISGFEMNGDSESIESTYAYHGGEPVLIGRVITGYDFDGGTVITTVEQLGADGQMHAIETRKDSLLGADAVSEP